VRSPRRLHPGACRRGIAQFQWFLHRGGAVSALRIHQFMLIPTLSRNATQERPHGCSATSSHRALEILSQLPLPAWAPTLRDCLQHQPAAVQHSCPVLVTFCILQGRALLQPRETVLPRRAPAPTVGFFVLTMLLAVECQVGPSLLVGVRAFKPRGFPRQVL
jgi:hypothetical protein